MATQALLDKIAADQREQVAAIEAETKERVAAIEAATASEIEALKADAAAASEKAVTAAKRAVISKAKQAGRLVVQTARREVLDEIMAKAEAQAVGDDAALKQQFNDRRADLEMSIAKELA